MAEAHVQGVPSSGIIDTRADITIIGGELFKKVASGARLKKRDFQKANTFPRTYMGQHFKLDEWMDLDVQFDGNHVYTSVHNDGCTIAAASLRGCMPSTRYN